jgi:hypothetical protein
MDKSWLFRTIMGDDPVEIPEIPKLPVIDEPLSATKRTGAGDSLIRQLELDATIKAIFDDEMLAMVKYIAAHPVASASLQPFPNLPDSTPNPRLPQCPCECANCLRQDCKNCLSDEQCEMAQHHLLNQILPVDDEEEAKLRAAVHQRQRAELAKKPLLKFRRDLTPIVNEFRDRLRPYSARVHDELFSRVMESMASYVADVVAAH